MKYIFTLAVLIISACDSPSIETIKIGSKETEYLYIKDFSNNLKAKNIILVIGDGTGLNQITLSSWAQRASRFLQKLATMDKR